MLVLDDGVCQRKRQRPSSLRSHDRFRWSIRDCCEAGSERLPAKRVVKVQGLVLLLLEQGRLELVHHLCTASSCVEASVQNYLAREQKKSELSSLFKGCLGGTLPTQRGVLGSFSVFEKLEKHSLIQNFHRCCVPNYVRPQKFSRWARRSAKCRAKINKINCDTPA